MNDSDLDLRSVLEDTDVNDDDPLADLHRRRKQFWIIVPILCGVIVIVGYLLLNAVVFDLRIDPQQVRHDAAIDTSDGMALVIGNKLILLSDQTNLEVNVEGYERFETQLKNNGPKRVDVRMLPLPGIVDLVVETPTPVEIRIDGKFMGMSNLRSSQLGAGTYEIQLTSSMIQPYSTRFEVQGFGKHQEFVFSPEPAHSFLTVRTNPANATIELDGEKLAPPVDALIIGIGSHELAVSAEGYVPRTVEFTTAFDEQIDLGTISLTANPVVLHIDTEPTDAAILIDGKFLGTTNSKISLEPRTTHSINIQKPNFRSVAFELVGEPGEEIRKSFRMEEISVAVKITASIEATVLRNGTELGKTPQHLKLQDKDRIVVTRQGYEAQSRVIRVANGSEQDFHFTLLTVEQHKYKSAPDSIEVTDQLIVKKFPSIRYSMTAGQDSWGAAGSSTSVPESMDIGLTRPFYLATTEVSIKDFDTFKGTVKAPSSNDRLPMTNVSWLEAAQFCNWLSQRDKLTPVYQFDANGIYRSVDQSALGYRLPTELEWLAIYSHDVQANRTVEPYPWGASSTIPRAYGNFAGRESSQKLDRFNQGYIDNHDGVAPIASYRPNVNGIFDMEGNVSEWMHDFYARWPNSRELTNYMGPKNGLDHVVRGGNFATRDSSELTTSFRRFVNGKDDKVGFRVARWVY